MQSKNTLKIHLAEGTGYPCQNFSKGLEVVKQWMEGLEPLSVGNMKHKIELINSETEGVCCYNCCLPKAEIDLKIHILHQVKSVSKLKRVLKVIKKERGLENDYESFVLLTYTNEEESLNRAIGENTALQLALQDNIFLKELNLESIQGRGVNEDMVSLLENFTLYCQAGGRDSPDVQMQETWARYLHANANLKLY
jgi:hypothetical protein